MAHEPLRILDTRPDPGSEAQPDRARRAALSKLAWVTPVVLTLTLSSRDSAASENLNAQDVPDYEPPP